MTDERTDKRKSKLRKENKKLRKGTNEFRLETTNCEWKLIISGYDFTGSTTWRKSSGATYLVRFITCTLVGFA